MRRLPVALALFCAIVGTAQSASQHGRIELDLRPRVCTLSGTETQCDTTVRATWQSTQPESLCLVIAERSDVKRCWDRYKNGSYSVELVFSDDLKFELRDSELQDVLAVKALKVIREALEFRRKRRQPWNIIF